MVNAQPLWAQYDSAMQDLTLAYQTPERIKTMYPFADLLKSGARIAMGSDWPVTTANPLHEIEVAVRRTPIEDPGADVFLPEQRLDLATAIDAFTAGAAFANRDDDSGTLREGLRGRCRGCGPRPFRTRRTNERSRSSAHPCKWKAGVRPRASVDEL